MTVIFPKNNLPEPAQPWAREVQKQLANVITSDRANEINNSTRDNQLNSSLISLTKVVSDVKIASDEATAAINGLTGLGSTGSAYTINASNINAGTISGNFISGGTISGASLVTSGTRHVEISGTSSKYYDESGTYIGEVSATSSGRSASLFMQNNTGSGIAVYNGGVDLYGNTGGATLTLSGGIVQASGTFQANNFVFFPGIDPSSSAANMRWGTGGPGKVQYSTASSRRFKNSIVAISDEIDLDPKKLLTIPVVAFKYNEDYLSSDDLRFNKMIPGFIAEDIEEIYEIAAENDGIGASDWNPRYVIPGMLALIQELYIRIETLENGA